MGQTSLLCRVTRNAALSLSVCGAAIASGCRGDDPTTAPKARATHLGLVGSSTQTRGIASAIGAPLVVTALSAAGTPVANELVEWKLVSGDAVISDTVTHSGADGTTSTSVQFGKTVGESTVEARLVVTPSVQPFRLTLVGSYRFLVDSAQLWLGDTSARVADWVDSAGLFLSGAAPSNTNLCSAAACLMPNGRLFARQMGADSLQVGSGPRSILQIAVMPVIRGHAYTLSGAPAVGAYVRAVARSGRDSVRIAPDGSFLFRARALPDSTGFDVWIGEGDPTNAVTFPSFRHLALTASVDTIAAVLLPRAWAVPTGPYANNVTAISVERAWKGGGYMSFWPALGGSPALHGQPTYLGRLPLAIDRTIAAVPVSAVDSTRLWSFIADLEARVGRALFYPTNFNASDTGIQVTVTLASSLGGNYGGGGRIDPACFRASTHAFCEARRGTANIAPVSCTFTAVQNATCGSPMDSTSLRPAIQHELLHTFGFGHTCGWRSLMAYNFFTGETAWCSSVTGGALSNLNYGYHGPDSFLLSLEDAVYFNLYLKIAEFVATHGTNWSVSEARNGEAVVLLGKSLIPDDAPQQGLQPTTPFLRIRTP